MSQTLTNVLGEAWQHFTHQVMDALPNLLVAVTLLPVGVVLSRFFACSVPIAAVNCDVRAAR